MFSYQLTIIIPVFNEADNLLNLESSLLRYINNSDYFIKILFINDGSTDQSQEIIEGICNRNKNFNVLKFSKNAGISAALKAGIDQTETELIGYIDSDLQTSPNDFDLLMVHISDYDLVTGIRASRNDPILKRFASKTANGIRRLFTNDGIEDTGCPLKIMKTKMAKSIPKYKGFHRFIPALVQLHNGKVKQVPVNHYKRVHGVSKFNTFNRLVLPLIDCFGFLWLRKRHISYSITKDKT